VRTLRSNGFRGTPLRCLVACVVGATVVALPQRAPAGPAQPDRAPGASHSVTLLTGDRIEYTEPVAGQPRVVVDPAPRPDGRAVTFTTTAVPGPGGQPALYVVPSDTEPYLAAGSVDRELFNVRQLTREGLDDRVSPTLPVILSYRTQPAAAAAPPAARATRALPAVHGQAVRVQRDQAEKFWAALRAPNGGARPALQRDIRKVWLAHRVRVTLDQSVPQIGAPAAWQAGYDGTGISVAVLDTGVDADHPDLRGRIAATSDFTDSGGTADGHGHGTHVASTIVGSGAASGGRYRGVAPGAKLLVGKVLADDGGGLDSWVMAGMEWAATSGAKVVSMSLGSEPTDGTDPVSAELDALTAQTGTLFVVAAVAKASVPPSEASVSLLTKPL